MKRFAAALVLATITMTAGAAATGPTSVPLRVRPITGFKRVAQFQMPSRKAEIVAATPDGRRLVVTNDTLGSVTVVNVANLNDIHAEGDIDLTAIYARAVVTSVAVTPDGKYALAAIRAGDHLHSPTPGFVAIIDLAARQLAGSLQAGIGPDAIQISSDGRFAVVANEDEEADPATGEVDMKQTRRPGTISIIEMPGGDPLKAKVTTLAVDLLGVPGATYAHDPQPEYVAISPDSKRAAVTLQENNAIAIVSLKAKRVERIFSLGTVTHQADLKRDGAVSFTDKLTARPEPDAIAWTLDGKYLVTANEGDLGKNEFMDGVRSGGRNITVSDPETGSVIWDSQSLIDELSHAAGLYPDSRSEDRGAEPEHVLVTRYGAQQIIVVATERANALHFIDATDVTRPVPIGVAPTGAGPESAVRIPSAQLIVSADEVSGTLTFFRPVR